MFMALLSYKWQWEETSGTIKLLMLKHYNRWMKDNDCRLNRQNNTFTIRQDLESKIQGRKLLSSCLKSVFDRSRHFKTHLNEKCPDQGTGDLDTSSLFDPHLQREVEVHQSQSSRWVWDALRQRDALAQRWKLSPRPWKHFQAERTSCSDWQIADAECEIKTLNWWKVQWSELLD